MSVIPGISKAQLEREAHREWYASLYNRLGNGVTFEGPNLQNEHTPYDLCYDIIKKLETTSDGIQGNILVLFNLEFVEVLVYEYGIESERITFVTDCSRKAKSAELDRYKGLNVFFTEDVLNWEPNMKFDHVIMNPPYQGAKEKKHDGKGKCGKSIWEDFVKKAISIAVENGFVCAIHPPRWRKPNSKIGKEMRKKQFCHIDIHGIDDGAKAFGCKTDYDWYVLQNKEVDDLTTITDQYGVQEKFNVSTKKMPFIPSASIKEVINLVAKDGEEKVEVLYSRSAYGTDKPHMSKEKTDEFKYPCVYGVKIKGTSTLWYSSKKAEFFGLPKVIWGNGHSGVYVDGKGEYGLTQFAYAIVDEPEVLPLIKKAIQSDRFLDSIMGYVRGLGHAYDRHIISCLRKDFWKEFVDKDGNEI